jgi:hypothetical protein
MAQLEFNPEKVSYTSDTQAWAVDQLGRVCDELYARNKPIVIFVHGRGIEPNKSLLGGTFVPGRAVDKIELGYNVSVLMFNWDSAFPKLRPWDRTRALGNTAAASRSFSTLLAALSDYFAGKPDLARPVLLVHSMGSIVIQKVVESGWPDDRVFRRIVFSQPDADDRGHEVWLTKLANIEEVLVTVNRDDKVLNKSTDDRPEGAHALGLGKAVDLASNAKYVDLSNMGALGELDDDHEVFGKGAMNGQLYVCQFFTQALRGDDVVLSDNLESVTRDVIYRLKSRSSPGAPCLKVPDLPDRN